MRTIYDAAERVDGRKLAATVGFFDGVHAGHRSLIAQLREVAAERGLASAVFTFPVHPRRVLQADYRPQLLDTFEDKLRGAGGRAGIISLCRPFPLPWEARRRPRSSHG